MTTSSLFAIKKGRKAQAQMLATILGNIAAIGYGLALYEMKLSCAIIASLAACMALFTARRAEFYDIR
jgi:hypothetical protein